GPDPPGPYGDRVRSRYRGCRRLIVSRRPLELSGADHMDSEHRDLVTKTRALIETTRSEISQLREEIQSAWTTIDRSQRLLSRTARGASRIARFRKEPRARQ